MGETHNAFLICNVYILPVCVCVYHKYIYLGGKAIRIVSFLLRSKVRVTSWASDQFTPLGLTQGHLGFNAL